jgi:hypothetical protein
MAARIAHPVKWVGYGPCNRWILVRLPAYLSGFCCPNCPGCLWHHTASYSVPIGPLSSGIKRPGLEAYIHFDVMPGFQWVESSLLSTIRLHGMHRDSFTFALLLLSYLIIYLATLSQLYCVMTYASTSSVLPGCGGGEESYLDERPQWMGFPVCCKWYSDTATDVSGWQRERSAKRDIGNVAVLWNSLNIGCYCFEFLETREGKCQCIRLNDS